MKPFLLIFPAFFLSIFTLNPSAYALIKEILTCPGIRVDLNSVRHQITISSDTDVANKSQISFKPISLPQTEYGRSKSIDLGTDADGYHRLLVLRGGKRFLEKKFDVKIRDRKTGTPLAEGRQKQMLPCK